MKSKYLYIGILLFIGILFAGCTKEEGETEPTYTIWSYSIPYSEYPGELDDGYYYQVELTNAEFIDFSSTLSNANKKYWTEEQIYNWFIGRNFIPTEANQKTAWMLTIDHGYIMSRSGNIIYSIIK
jgi:hypothetical protein